MTPSRRALVGALAALPLAAQAAAADGVLLRPWPKGRATPPLDLPGFDGPRFSLAAARGRVVLLNFWASWCEPCRDELPTLELLAARHERDGLDIVAVNFRETDAALRRFAALMPITLPIVRDADGAAARAWGARIFPTTRRTWLKNAAAAGLLPLAPAFAVAQERRFTPEAGPWRTFGSRCAVATTQA